MLKGETSRQEPNRRRGKRGEQRRKLKATDDVNEPNGGNDKAEDDVNEPNVGNDQAEDDVNEPNVGNDQAEDDDSEHCSENDEPEDDDSEHCSENDEPEDDDSEYWSENDESEDDASEHGSENDEQEDDVDESPHDVPSTSRNESTFKLPKHDPQRSALFLNDEWGTSKGGISSVNRQLALQAKNTGYDVYVTVLDVPSEDDVKDAEKNGIKLIIAKKFTGIEVKVHLNMINKAHDDFFPSLEEKIRYLNVIVGHVPITSEGALDIKKRFSKAKVYLFTHVIPQETDFHKGGYYKLGDIETKVDTIIKQAEQADLIFSVGPKVYSKFKSEFRRSKVNENKHKEFIPIPDNIFFELDLKPFKKKDAYEVLTVGRVANVENLKGYDIVAAALGNVTKHISSVTEELSWRIRGISDEDKDKSLEYIKKHLKSVEGNLLEIYPLQYGDQKQVRDDIHICRLFLMPSRTEPFGMVGLEAMAAGLPVLVTANSGLATFLNEHFPKYMSDSMIVPKSGKTDIEGITVWKKRITDVLFKKYKHTFELAKEVKRELINFQSNEKCQIFIMELDKLPPPSRLRLATDQVSKTCNIC